MPSEPRRRGAQPTALPREYADFLAAYTGALADVPLAADTKRTYVSWVRMYLAWLASPAASRRSQGAPLVNPRARDWAVRDYRFYLLRDADPKRSVRYSNNALAALDDFHVRLGLGKAEIGRDDLPKTAPRPSTATRRSGGCAPSRTGRTPGTGCWRSCRSTPGCASATPLP